MVRFEGVGRGVRPAGATALLAVAVLAGRVAAAVAAASLEQRIVAVALADQVGAVLAVPTAREQKGVD